MARAVKLAGEFKVRHLRGRETRTRMVATIGGFVKNVKESNATIRLVIGVDIAKI